MADKSAIVTISGPVLSLLFYENACSVGDQMGFLLGEIVMYVSKSVTDSERQIDTVVPHIEIKGILTCPTVCGLYDNNGKLFKDPLKSFIREHSKEIVGWFRFRRDCRLVPTFRDKIIHKELAAYFHECNPNVPTQMFLACILNSSKTEKKGTHRFKHVFLRYDQGVYKPIRSVVNNIGHDATRQDGSEYVLAPQRRFSQEPDIFTKFVKSLNLDPNNKSASKTITAIHKASDKHMESLIPKLCESDREVHELERQIRELRLKIVRRCMSPENFKKDNLRATEFNNQSALRTDGEQNLKVDRNQETVARTSNVNEESRINNGSSSRTKLKSVIPTHNIRFSNTIRNSNDSAQKSSSQKSYSDVIKNSGDNNQDLYNASNV